jgi:predicted DNA binding CopG/RHH family protein
MARKTIPKFASESEEQDFWNKHDSTEFIDWTKGRVGVFPELKPSTKTISLRLPEAMLSALKTLANKRDVPYQSLMKVFLAQQLREELEAPNARRRSRNARRGRG